VIVSTESSPDIGTRQISGFRGCGTMPRYGIG
jgi:hypothetical protein